ncbi:MAG: hypothetical protein JRD89_04325 [Deltaproteobacteria bacterium]|nr:hypothetical protein [Deltaproteobacteria bacterium]
MSSLRTILGLYYKTGNHEFDLPHNLRFVITSQLLNVCKYTVQETVWILKNLSIIDVPEDRLEREARDWSDRGYAFGTYDAFSGRVLNGMVFRSDNERRRFENMLHRLYETFERWRDANKEVSENRGIHRRVLARLTDGIAEDRLFKHIYNTAQDATYICKPGGTEQLDQKKAGVSAYTSLEAIKTRYLREIGKRRFERSDYEPFTRYAISTIREILTRNKDLLVLDFDYSDGASLEENREANRAASEYAFETLTRTGLDIVWHSTGGKGHQIKVYLGRVPLESAEKEWLKGLVVNLAKNLGEEVFKHFGTPVEIKDGSNTYISLWYGRHRKTGDPKEILGASHQNIGRIRDWVIEESGIHLDVSIPLQKPPLEVAIQLNRCVANVRPDSRPAVIQSLRSYAEDLTDTKYNIPTDTDKILQGLDRTTTSTPLRSYSEFRSRYGIDPPVLEIHKVKNYYRDQGLGDWVNRFDGVIFDFETTNRQPFAHKPAYGTFFFPEIPRLTIWMDSEEQSVERYQEEGGIEIRVIRSRDPEQILGALFPEHLILGIMSEYGKRGSYLSEVDIQKFQIVDPDVNYIRRILKERDRPIYLVAHNAKYDIPILISLLSGIKEGTVLTVERKQSEDQGEATGRDPVNGDEVIIDLYGEHLKVTGRLRKIGSSGMPASAGWLEIADQRLKILDTMNLGNFWAAGGSSRSLKALSRQFNHFFHKTDFDVSQIGEDTAAGLEYNIQDVLATWELIYSLIPQDILEMASVNFGGEELQIQGTDLFKLEDFIRIVSSATIPKRVVERMIRLMNPSQYKTNSAVLNPIFKRFFYGGRVKAKIGRKQGVSYLDFNSQYPHIMNYIRLENIIANLSTRDHEDIIRSLDEDQTQSEFREQFQAVIDEAIENNTFKPVADFSSRYPQGAFHLRPKTYLLELDRKVREQKTGGEHEWKGQTFDLIEGAFGNSGTDRRRDVRCTGTVNVDLPALIYHAFDWRLANPGRSWRRFWNNVIRIDWQNSFVIHMRDLLHVEGDYQAYGVKSKTLPHIALQKREKYKKLMKQHPEGSPERRDLDISQTALKIFSNSAYGIFAEDTWQWKNYMIASAITGYGRMMQRIAELLAGRQGVQMIYSDTDGMFFAAPASDPRLEKVCKFFEGVDGLKFEEEDTIDEISILAPKTYRYRIGDRTVTKTHGRGAYMRTFAGRELFGTDYYNALFDYLEGDDTRRDHADMMVEVITITSKNNSRQENIAKYVSYAKAKEEEIRAKGYTIQNGYVITHILPPGERPFGKFFTIVHVSGTLDDQAVRYLLTSNPDEEEILSQCERLGLVVKHKPVYDTVTYRLRKLRSAFMIPTEELTLDQYRGLFRVGKIREIGSLTVQCREKPVNTHRAFSRAATMHSTEWILEGRYEKPTTYPSHVRHHSQAISNLYHMDRNIFGGRWISKTPKELVFRYKREADDDETDNIRLVKASGDDDAEIIIRLPFEANDRVQPGYVVFKVYVTINIPELGPYIDHRRLAHRALVQWWQDLQPYIHGYVASFAPEMPSKDIYKRVLETVTIWEFAKRIQQAIEEDINNSNLLLTSPHYACDIELTADQARILAHIFTDYEWLIQEEINQHNDTVPVQKVMSEVDIRNTQGSLHLDTKGFRFSLYRQEQSKLDRLKQRYRKTRTTTALRNIRKQQHKINQHDGYIYRLEVQPLGRRLFTEGFEVFTRAKQAYGKLIEKIHLIKHVSLMDFSTITRALFEPVIIQIREHLKQIRRKGRTALSRIHRYAIVSISILAVPQIEWGAVLGKIRAWITGRNGVLVRTGDGGIAKILPKGPPFTSAAGVPGS